MTNTTGLVQLNMAELKTVFPNWNDPSSDVLTELPKIGAFVKADDLRHWRQLDRGFNSFTLSTASRARRR